MITGPAGMPIKGSGKAPRTFDGHYLDISQFLTHLERLYAQHRIDQDSEKVKLILDYCSHKVRSFIKTTEAYRDKKWEDLKTKLLDVYDAERSEPIYTLADVIRLVAKNSKKPITRLEKWKKYVLDFETIAGSIYNSKRMSKYDYHSYFWGGIHPSVKTAFAPMLLVKHASHDASQPYTIEQLNGVAEIVFKRDRFNDLMPSIINWGANSESSDSDSDSDSESEDSDSEEEYGRSRRKESNWRKREKAARRRRKEKRKEKEQKQKQKQSINVSKSEVDGLIDRINKITLLNMEQQQHNQMHNHQQGYTARCVHCDSNQQDNFVGNVAGPPSASQRPPIPTLMENSQQQFNPPNFSETRQLYNPANQGMRRPFPSYPNNIRLPVNQTPGQLTLQQPPFECFGCFSKDHMLGECPRMHELIQQGIL
ncbi:hypothetical protein GALMADRAFT_1351073, partial [Galerina marginata CBS 339.88]